MTRAIRTGGFISRRVIHLSPVARYGIAIVAAEAATVLHLVLDPIWHIQLPYIVFYPAVMISAWFGGLRPGALTILSAIAADFFWLRPSVNLLAGDPTDIGGILAFITVGVFISTMNEAWRNAALAIAESEERLRVTLTSIADAVITTDEIGIVTHLNTVAEKLTGWTELDAVGRPVEDVFVIINEHNGQQTQNPIERVVTEGVTCALSTVLISKGGRNIPIDDTAAPIKTKDGRTAGVVMVFRDITVRRALNERERLARHQAEEANRAKDEFLAMLSHELRTPLSSILGWSTILKSKDLPLERASHALEVIERNARVEAQLVESLLDLSRISAGKLKLAMEPVDLSSVVMTAVDSLRPTADAKGVTLDAKPFGEPIWINGDSGRLQQVFSNLLSNAIKFTPREGHVQVQSTRRDSEVQIKIVDDGEGISSEFLPHVFGRFRQADSATGRAHGGLGLGLAIVRELVHAHDGTIVANSLGTGRGSTFTVTLPVPAVVQPNIEMPTGQTNAEEPSILKLRVLVVDDDNDARELIGLTLESRGAVVFQASSAREAVEFIRRDRPDVLVADIAMPQEDGYALIRKLRAAEREEQQKHLPAIALTAYASPSDREQALIAGYDQHLAKPVHQRELARAVAKIFNDQRAPALYRRTHQ
jgi:PAS domain S-box-containing protein